MNMTKKSLPLDLTSSGYLTQRNTFSLPVGTQESEAAPEHVPCDGNSVDDKKHFRLEAHRSSPDCNWSRSALDITGSA